jgi:ABC-type multidrug transport system fused ATPase/permease subunit
MLPINWLWAVIIFWFAIFFIVVYMHNRMDIWISKYKIYREIKATNQARMELAWSDIPHSASQASPNPISIDLDLAGPRSIHHLIDLAVSNEGSQRLANWLSQPLPEPQAIISRQRIVRELAPMTTFRNQLLLRFKTLSDQMLSGRRLMDWMLVNIAGGRYLWNLWIGLVLVTANISLFILSILDILPNYWIITTSLYLVFYIINQKPNNLLLEAAVVMDRELDIFRSLLGYLETYSYGRHIALQELCGPYIDPNRKPSKLLSKIKLATVGVGFRMNPIMGLVLNLLLPWDFFFSYLINVYRNTAIECLPDWLVTWYELEALMSLANFAYLFPGYIFPTFVPHPEEATPTFQATSLGHPLIPPDQKICNDISINNNGDTLIITGSNMAGKSTFVKTIGINHSLAYAGGPVDAQSFITGFFRLHSCIHISDSIADGFSYFYAEVKCLRSLMDKISEKHDFPVLYIIDEIFRGTNNRERLIGSRSFIKHITGNNAIGLIATHDLELANLAMEHTNIKNYHFRDNVIEGKLTFDYKLLPGPSMTTNALEIMRIEGLPVE